jgi:hypothetical protein
VARDVALPQLDTALPAVPRDVDTLLQLAQRWGVESPVRRLVDAASGA